MAKGEEGKATGWGRAWGGRGIHTLPPVINGPIPGLWQGALW